MKGHAMKAGKAAADHVEPCITAAESLLEVLREESVVLRRFMGKDLLALLPRKEFLVQDLGKKMRSYKDSGARKGGNPRVGILRTLLMEIDKINRLNRVFIEGSLDYWRELLRALFPSNYSAGRRHSAVPAGVALKGLSLRVEV